MRNTNGHTAVLVVSFFVCFKMNINNAHCTVFINAKAGEVLKTFEILHKKASKTIIYSAVYK